MIELNFFNETKEQFTIETNTPHQVFSAVDVTIDDDEIFSKYLQRQEQRNATTSITDHERYIVSSTMKNNSSNIIINRQHKRLRMNHHGPFTNV